MGSFRCHILFTFICVFCSITEVFSQESTVEVYEYSYVTRGGKTIQESTTIYVTDDPHEVFNGYRWINGKYFIIAIISRKGKFILKTFNEEGRVKKGKYTEYSVIGNPYFVNKVVISEGLSQVVFYKFTGKNRIILSKYDML